MRKENAPVRNLLAQKCNILYLPKKDVFQTISRQGILQLTQQPGGQSDIV